ncbi:LmbU family transcriptional regulator [Sphaerisporangium aureirubrum]|uniref:LmbU family transcriptional regulator n=1 Tax=Sphaerisporangium aureirubrum TaxID=1544736 RepID=A0ABW1NQP4_9ACTN
MLTTKVGLRLPPTLSFDEWELAGRRLSGIIDSSCWWLGDWLVFGKDRYADRYQRGIVAAGLQYQTLRNYAWVSRRFLFHRRRESLTFQHHAELASLPVEVQDNWLDQAEQGGWTTKQLRNAVQLSRQAALPASAASRSETVEKLALPGGRVDCWRKAAEQSGTALEQWVLATLDHAAEQILGSAKPAALNAAVNI